MKYLVDIKETSYATIEVEANSAEEASVNAEEAYFSGRVDWDDSDLDIEVRE